MLPPTSWSSSVSTYSMTFERPISASTWYPSLLSIYSIDPFSTFHIHAASVILLSTISTSAITSFDDVAKSSATTLNVYLKGVTNYSFNHSIARMCFLRRQLWREREQKNTLRIGNFNVNLVNTAVSVLVGHLWISNDAKSGFDGCLTVLVLVLRPSSRFFRRNSFSCSSNPFLNLTSFFSFNLRNSFQTDDCLLFKFWFFRYAITP